MRQRVIKSDSIAALPAYCPAVAVQRRPAVVAPIANPRHRRNERGEKLVTVASYFDARADDHDQLPMIRLRGQWLQRIGFKAGERLVVTEEDGRIVLTLLREEQ